MASEATGNSPESTPSSSSCPFPAKCVLYRQSQSRGHRSDKTGFPVPVRFERPSACHPPRSILPLIVFLQTSAAGSWTRIGLPHLFFRASPEPRLEHSRRRQETAICRNWTCASSTWVSKMVEGEEESKPRLLSDGETRSVPTASLTTGHSDAWFPSSLF